MISIISKGIREQKNKFRINREENWEIWDINNLKKEVDSLPQENIVNRAYGHLYHIRKFANTDQSRRFVATIEHGITIERPCVIQQEVEHPTTKILVMSPYRVDMINTYTDLEGIAIGPYIAYAEDYYSEDRIMELKKRYGRILLAFPNHGIKDMDFSYDCDMFIDEIKKISAGFDTVMVCLYYHDLQMRMGEKYKKQGYIVVSAGAVYSRFFLCRLKTIIGLSDAVVGNAMTTGLSYALYFGKPVYVYKQFWKYDNNSVNNFTQMEENKEILDEFYELSSDPEFKNIEEQKKWGAYHFGLNSVRSRKEMSDLLSELMW